MTITVSVGGWVRSVNGVPVVKRRLASGFYHGWGAPPRGVMLHGTAGCADDIYTTLVNRGISVHFCIGRDGTIYQYVSLLDRAAHAYAAANTHFAVEHTGQSNACRPYYTDRQLESSAKLSAGLREYVKQKHDVRIPLTHVPGCDLNTRGFKEHYDGFVRDANGDMVYEAGLPRVCSWNPNRHVDRPGTFWGWAEYLTKVTAYAPTRKVYKYRGRTFGRLRNALRRLRRDLVAAAGGDHHTIRVVEVPE